MKNLTLDKNTGELCAESLKETFLFECLSEEQLLVSIYNSEPTFSLCGSPARHWQRKVLQRVKNITQKITS